MIYNLKVTEDELRILSAALYQLPFKDVAALIMNLDSQIKEQKNNVQNNVE